MALREAGIRLTLQGAAEYKAGLKGVSQEIRTMATESKLALAQLGNNASITDTYNTRMKGMGTQLQSTGKRVDTLRGQQEKLNKIYSELPKRVNDVNRAYQDSVKETDRLENNYKQMSKALGENHKETIKAKQAWEESKTTTSGLKTEHKELADELKRTEKELTKLPNELAKAELATQRLRNESERLHEEYRKQGGRLADTAKSWRESGEALENLGGRVQTAGGLISGFGSALTKGVTVPLVGIGALALSSAMSWESSFAGVMKTNDEIFDSNGKLVYGYEQLESELRNLARTIPVAHEELGNIAENAGQLGIATQDVASFTEVVAKLGHTTNLSYEEASTALAQFLNVTGSGTDTVSNLSSSIVALGNNTAATEKDILLMSQRWATTGAMIGLTDDQIVAFSASLISMGVNVEAGGSALQRFGQKVNSHVLDAGDGLTLLAETAGMTASEFSDAWNNEPAKAIESFLQGLDGVVKEGGNANQLLKELGITSVNELNALLALAGGHEQLADALGLSAEAYSENTALSEEFATFAETTSAQVQILQNKIKDIAIEFGGPLASALTSALNAAEPWIEKLAEMATGFSEMDEEGQRNILMWAGIAAAAGPVISIFGNMVTGIGGLISGFGTLKTLVADVIQWFGKSTTERIADTATELGKIPGAATSAGAGASLFSSPWVIAGGVAIGAVAGFVAYMNHEANKPFKAHEEAVDATNGKYQEWFDAMVDGMGTIDELHNEARDQSDETTQNYQENIEELLASNQKVQEAIALTQDKGGIFGWLTDSNQTQIEVGAERITLRMTKLSDALKDLGQSDSEVTRLNNAFTNYGTTLGTVMSNVITVTEEGKAVTHEWASTNIQAVKDVSTETVTRLQEKRQAEIDALNQTRDNTNMEQQIYQEKLDAINSSYDQQITAVEQAQANIQAILTAASEEQRALSDQDVVHILQNMQEIATGTGKSLSEVEGVAQLIGNNLSALVSTVGLDFLVQAGLIDEAMAQNIAGVEDADAKTRLLSEALGEYAGINVEPKSLDVNSDVAELIEITELISKWNELTVEEKIAQIQGRGGDELQQLVETLGVDWNSLTPEQHEAIVNTSGKEQVEEVLWITGEWNNLTLDQKIAILEAQIDNEAVLTAIDSRDLWNNEDFRSQFAQINTNAPDAQEQIANLVSQWTNIPVEEVKRMMTDTNADETTPDIQAYRGEVEATPATASSTFTAGVGGVSEATGIASDWKGTVEEVPESKTSGIQTNVFSTIANTLAITLYNAAVGAMTDKSVEASTSTPNMLANTLLITGYNSASGKMKDTKATATTRTPNLPRHTNLVKDWNSAMRDMFNKTSTATTKTPNIASNTSSVWSWINALNSAYNRTSTLTTNRVTRYSTIGISPRGYKDGGHIDAYADGGEIRWGGMFANGGNVPPDYVGIVGEAGPELFHVTKSGVSITPLAPGEKMRGVEGAIEDYMKGKGSGGGDSYSIDINISDVTIRDDRDIDKLTDSIGERLVKRMQRDKKMRKGSVVGFG